MESSPNEKVPDEQEPHIPEEFADLDTGAEEESGITAERMDNLFQSTLNEDTEAFKEMWTRVEGFIEDEEKWKDDPVIRNFKLSADRENGEGTNEKPFDTLKDYLQEGSIEDAIHIANNEPFAADVNALHALGRILNHEFKGDRAGGSAALSELGKRIELAIKAHVVSTKEARGEDASDLRKTIEEQLASGKQNNQMSDPFQGYIRDTANSREKKLKSSPTNETREKTSNPIVPWKLEIEKEQSPIIDQRRTQLQHLLLPTKENLEESGKNWTGKKMYEKAWEGIAEPLLQDSKISPDSAFAKMAKRGGNLKDRLDAVDQIMNRLEKGGLTAIQNPSKLSKKEISALRLSGLLFLEAGYKDGKQEDFQDMRESKKLMIRMGEIIGMVAEGDILRRVAQSEQGLAEERGRRAHKRYWQFMRSKDIPAPLQKYFGQVEEMLRKKFKLEDSFKQPGEPGYKKPKPVAKEKVSKLSPEERRQALLSEIHDWQRMHPHGTFNSWKIAQMSNPDAIRNFEEIAKELEDGEGKKETPEEVWERLYNQALEANQTEARELSEKLKEWREAHPDGSLNEWRLSRPSDAVALKRLAAATRKEESDVWNMLAGIEAPSSEPEASPEPSAADTEPTEQSPSQSREDLDPSEKKALNQVEQFQKSEEFREKYPGFNYWKKEADEKILENFLTAAKRMDTTPELLWNRLKQQSSTQDSQESKKSDASTSPEETVGKKDAIPEPAYTGRVLRQIAEAKESGKYKDYEAWRAAADAKTVEQIDTIASSRNVGTKTLWDRLKRGGQTDSAA